MLYNKKMISLPKQVWTVWDFTYANGNNPIEEWRLDLSEDAQGVFDAILKNECKIENHLEWSSFKKVLKGELKGIWELEFFADGRQYRILGMFSGHKQVTLLMGCYHKQKVYTPADALKTALKRKNMLAKGEANKIERKIKFDI